MHIIRPCRKCSFLFLSTIRRLADGELVPILVIVGPLAVSIVAAALLRRYVEHSDVRLAGRIGYSAARSESPLATSARATD